MLIEFKLLPATETYVPFHSMKSWKIDHQVVSRKMSKNEILKSENI